MSRWPNKYVIGLTGNIAVGKSLVRQMLQHAGAYTIDADSLAHQTMMPGAPAYKPVVQTFGQAVVGSDGRINRAMLGKIVFSSPDMLTKLEAITHPVVRKAVDLLVTRSKKRVVVIEAIKLLEGDLANWVDEIWVVDAKPQTQYKRLITRRKMSQEDAKQRILAQSSQAEKLKRADVVVQNDGDVEKTWKQVQTEWVRIRKQLQAQAAPKQPTAPATGQTADQAAPATAPAADVQEDDAPQSITVDGVTVTRGMPGNAQSIADFIATVSGKPVSRMDVMMSFGQKSYIVAKDRSDQVVGMMGWTVENLVTRMDEFYVRQGVNPPAAAVPILSAVEEASKELQSEVSFVFLPDSTSQPTLEAFTASGYEAITLSEIKVPAWREAVEEVLSERANTVVYWKQLRKDRVLQPI